MAYRARKTEHTGAKHGRGAYWGRKWEAKKESSKIRRRNWKQELAGKEKGPGYTVLFEPAEEGGYVVTCPALLNGGQWLIG